MKDAKLIKYGVIHALGVSIYVSFISIFVNNAGKIFGNVENKLIVPVVFLLLFVFSALLTGSLVLGKPVMLYLDGAKKEAVKLLLYTGISLFVMWLIFVGLLIILK